MITFPYKLNHEFESILVVIAHNLSENHTQDVGTIKTRYIYDVLSLINHSCSPNLWNIWWWIEIENETIETFQLFINYLGSSESIIENESQAYLSSIDVNMRKGFRSNSENHNETY